jgi:hypothetical protein
MRVNGSGVAACSNSILIVLCRDEYMKCQLARAIEGIIDLASLEVIALSRHSVWRWI